MSHRTRRDKRSSRRTSFGLAYPIPTGSRELQHQISRQRLRSSYALQARVTRLSTAFVCERKLRHGRSRPQAQALLLLVNLPPPPDGRLRCPSRNSSALGTAPPGGPILGPAGSNRGCELPSARVSISGHRL